MMPEAKIIRPAAPSTSDRKSSEYSPDQLNADLGMVAMAREVAKTWPIPIIVNAKYAAFYGIWTGLNHVPVKNETYYNSSRRIAIYREAGIQSVNVDGRLFNSYFALWSKPNYTIMGMPQLSGGQEEKPGWLSRLWTGLTGRGKQPQQEAGKQ